MTSTEHVSGHVCVHCDGKTWKHGNGETINGGGLVSFVPII